MCALSNEFWLNQRVCVVNCQSGSSSMTRRNTYVCSERNSVLQNGKENRYESTCPSERATWSSVPDPVCFPPRPSSSATTTPQKSVGGASTHSVSSGATPPDRLRFPRGTASRSTFHGGQLRERRAATYNGPPASPSLSHDATPLAQSRARGSTNLFSKLTSKLTRRYTKARHHGWLSQCVFKFCFWPNKLNVKSIICSLGQSRTWSLETRAPVTSSSAQQHLNSSSFRLSFLPFFLVPSHSVRGMSEVERNGRPEGSRWVRQAFSCRGICHYMLITVRTLFFLIG